jgi:hypothetical protein
MPTGSGKTWIQGLLCKHFCDQGQKVAVIEPNQALMLQTSELLGHVHYAISYLTLEDYYKGGAPEDVLILDEYDSMVVEQPYLVYNTAVRGLWSLRGRKVFAFSATSTSAIENFIARCITVPAIHHRQSEYELVNKTSPILDGKIRTCSDP